MSKVVVSVSNQALDEGLLMLGLVGFVSKIERKSDFLNGWDITVENIDWPEGAFPKGRAIAQLSTSRSPDDLSGSVVVKLIAEK